MSLKPGESRIVEVKACPLNQYVHPNEYWMLRRAAKRLLYNHVEEMWIDPPYGAEIMDAVAIIRMCAEQIPTHPPRSWERYGYGIVREICCPACYELFTVEGNFYVPQCTKCKRVLSERKL